MRVSRSTRGLLIQTAPPLRVSCVAPPLEPPVSPTHTRACVATVTTTQATHATLAEQLRSERRRGASIFTRAPFGNRTISPRFAGKFGEKPANSRRVLARAHRRAS